MTSIAHEDKLALHRVRLVSDLEVLGLSSGQQGALVAADLGWTVARLGLWIQNLPFSMLITGVKSPEAFRVGHRGPLRRALSRRMVRSRGRGALSVDREHELAGLDDGTIVTARGVVEASASLPGQPGVLFQSVSFQVDSVGTMTERLHLVYEAAVDFGLRCGDQRSVLHVEAARGLLLAPRKKGWQMAWTPPGSVFDLPLSAEVQKKLDGRRCAIRKRHQCRVLRQGDEVIVIGVKGRALDPNVDRLARDAPLRPSICTDGRAPVVVICKKRAPEGT